MKKYILLALTAITAIACVDNDFEPASREYVGFRLQGVPTTVAENSAGITIPLYYGGDFENDRTITVNYEVSGGNYGADYTIVGGSAASGSITIPAGTTWKDAISNLVIKGVPDFNNEPNVPLTVALTSADDGVQVGYPLAVSYSFTIADDDCLFDFEGDLEGIEATFDGLDIEEENTVSIVSSGEGELTIEGLGQTMISDFWAEEVISASPIIATIVPGGAFTIEEQPVFTTVYDGDPYDYLIKGTGQVNYCEGTVTIIYDIYYADGSGSIAEYANTHKTAVGDLYMSTELFVATLSPVED